MSRQILQFQTGTITDTTWFATQQTLNELNLRFSGAEIRNYVLSGITITNHATSFTIAGGGVVKTLNVTANCNIDQNLASSATTPVTFFTAHISNGNLGSGQNYQAFTAGGQSGARFVAGNYEGKATVGGIESDLLTPADLYLSPFADAYFGADKTVFINKIQNTITGSAIALLSAIRMFNTTESAITSPAAGDIYYDTDIQKVRAYFGGHWNDWGTGSGGSEINIYDNNTFLGPTPGLNFKGAVTLAVSPQGFDVTVQSSARPNVFNNGISFGQPEGYNFLGGIVVSAGPSSTIDLFVTPGPQGPQGDPGPQGPAGPINTIYWNGGSYGSPSGLNFTGGVTVNYSGYGVDINVNGGGNPTIYWNGSSYGQQSGLNFIGNVTVSSSGYGVDINMTGGGGSGISIYSKGSSYGSVPGVNFTSNLDVSSSVYGVDCGVSLNPDFDSVTITSDAIGLPLLRIRKSSIPQQSLSIYSDADGNYNMEVLHAGVVYKTFLCVALRTDISSPTDGNGSVNWIASSHGGASGGNRVVIGCIDGRACVGAHNQALSAWQTLYLNYGGNVVVDNHLLVNQLQEYSSGEGITVVNAIRMFNTTQAAVNLPKDGFVIFDTASKTFKGYNGLGWVEFTVAGGSGVTSLTGTANQVIISPASTGALTASLPQDIGVNSNVTFGDVTVATLFAKAPGDGIMFGNFARPVNDVEIDLGRTDKRFNTFYTQFISGGPNPVSFKTSALPDGDAVFSLGSLSAAWLTLFANRLSAGNGQSISLYSNVACAFNNTTELGHPGSAFKNIYTYHIGAPEIAGEPDILVEGNLLPHDPLGIKTRTLGDAAQIWDEVWCVTLHQTSDEKKKNISGDLSEKEAIEFVKKAIPIVYSQKKTPAKKEWGFGARQIKRDTSFPGVFANDKDEHSLEYIQMIPALVKACQVILDKQQII